MKRRSILEGLLALVTLALTAPLRRQEIEFRDDDVIEMTAVSFEGLEKSWVWIDEPVVPAGMAIPWTEEYQHYPVFDLRESWEDKWLRRLLRSLDRTSLGLEEEDYEALPVAYKPHRSKRRSPSAHL